MNPLSPRESRFAHARGILSSVQEACLPASVFQPAVIRAMINACASLKLAVPAAVLCQLLLPTPYFHTAFTLLKTTPAARLDVDYFEFLWEVRVK